MNSIILKTIVENKAYLCVIVVLSIILFWIKRVENLKDVYYGDVFFSDIPFTIDEKVLIKSYDDQIVELGFAKNIDYKN